MNRRRGMVVVLATVMVLLVPPHVAFAQEDTKSLDPHESDRYRSNQLDAGVPYRDRYGHRRRPVYDPYPPGILPRDLNRELRRVRREVRRIFWQTLQEANQLGPIVFEGNPPTIAGNGYEAVRLLGELMNYDLNMSVDKNQACASCHMPYTSFSGPIPSVNLTMIGYPGSSLIRANNRVPMRYAYAPRFPVLNYNEAQQLFFGGNFWDGRATGYLLQNPNAEQATDPPVGAVEQGFPDTACIAYRLSQAPYWWLFEEIWGPGSLDIKFPRNAKKICSTPAGARRFGNNPTPMRLSPEDRVKADVVYQHWGQSLSFYQSSADVTAFSSKFDAYLAGTYELTEKEKAGYDLFRGKGNCNSCHLDGRSTPLAPLQFDNGTPANVEPLFTCVGYANIGVPLNPRNAFYYETKPDSFGFTPNPNGFADRDLGFGNFLRSVNGINPNDDWTDFAPLTDGQMQVVTARNSAMTPTQCPTTESGQRDERGKLIPFFQKGFFHNGYIKSLKQLVHFYNTRDLFMYDVTSGNCPEGTTEKVDCWPKPEIPNNLDMTVGNLGLTDEEEDLIVIFLETLTDGFIVPYPNQDAYLGRCEISDVPAAIQGNETLIPTPKLPECAPDICEVPPLPEPPIR